MFTILYLIIGVVLGWNETKKQKGSRSEFIEKDGLIFFLYVFFWLPIYLVRFLKKMDLDFD